MSNKKIKEKLCKKYGNHCMFEESPIRKDKRVIKSYKKFLRTTKYNKKKIRKLKTILTVHHLKHVSEGGETSIENTAILSEISHRYFHSLPRREEEILNEALRKYKYEIDVEIIKLEKDKVTLEENKCKKILYNGEEINNNDFITIPLENNNKDANKNQKKCQKKKMTRTRKKLEIKKEIERQLLESEQDDYYEER